MPLILPAGAGVGNGIAQLAGVGYPEPDVHPFVGDCMSQPPPPGDWPDPYALGPGSESPAGQPTQPAYPPAAYGTPSGPPGYGYPPPYPGPGYPGYPPPAPTNGLAIASLVCSLAGLAVGISAPVGAILGHVARRQIRERGEQGDGMALAGIIVGWILTAGLIVCCGLYAGLIGFAFTQEGNF
jgi:hypothetical protein